MATVKKISLTTMVLSLSLSSTAQSIVKVFSGSWADTWWTFEFKKNATYTRTSVGHYGFTEVKGNYKIINDTIQLLSGFKNTHGTINEFYLLEKDSFLIDLTLLYDYRLTNDRSASSYRSRTRYDIAKKPNPDSIINKTLLEFDSLVTYTIGQLKSKDILRISDQDNITIIRISNTISISVDGNNKKRFAHGIYADFEKLLNDQNYQKEVTKKYEWIPTRGMGFYFQKLQIELGGTPNFYSLYIVK